MTTAATITKTEAVIPFGRFNDTENSVIFELAYKESGQIYRQVILTRNDWEELGSPQEITVRIRPGSALTEDVEKQETVEAAES